MPEGDTLYRTAVTLRKALLGRKVTRFETSIEAVAVVQRKMPVEGRLISEIEARGKHLLITFAPEETPTGVEDDANPPANSAGTVPQTSSADLPPPSSDADPGPRTPLVLHTHLRMTGSWHVYRPGERWQKPERYAKVVIHTDAFVVPCFSAPVVELLTEWQARRHPALVTLGPDAMTEEFDPEAAFERLRRHPDVPIGVALMNQRLMSGVGNVYKSEVLFTQRVSPFVAVGELEDAVLRGLIAESHRLLRLNQNRGERRTVFGLSEHDRLWAYGRSGEPCRVCGETIRMRRQGIDARSTYYCPRCQHTG